MEQHGRRKGKGAESIGDLLAGFLKTSPIGRAVAREDLEGAWRAAVGPEIAGSTRVRGLRDGVLTVEVGSSALLQELATFCRAEILASLRAGERGARDVRELTFRLGVFEPGAKRDD